MKNYNENGELTYTIIYIYIGWNTIYEKTIYPDLTETETKYIYGASGHMAKITDTGTIETTTFYHTDVLGSVRQKTDSDGNSLWASIAIYKPFGGLYSGGPSDESETHLYTGKTYDYGTGLYYYGDRFYDPEVGRFVTKDIHLPRLDNPQSLNEYTYCYNNPLKYIDPDGRWSFLAGLLVLISSNPLIILIAFVLMVGIIAAYNYYKAHKDELTFETDIVKEIDHYVDKDGRLHIIGYDKNGSLCEEIFDKEGRKIYSRKERADGTNKIETWEYDENGRLVKKTETIERTDGTRSVIETVYNPDGSKTVTHTVYDADGNIIHQDVKYYPPKPPPPPPPLPPDPQDRPRPG